MPQAKKSAPKKAAKPPSALWAGRFEQGMASSMETLSVSLGIDRKLFREDIEGSIAHSHGLFAAKVLTSSELARMEKGLLSVLKDLNEGADLFVSGDEDIHMAVERILTVRIGDLGKKLHTGRSRNDQVATDFRLYVMRRAHEVEAKVRSLQTNLLAKAKVYEGQLMPGYTHVQQAQPIAISHYLMSFFFALERDALRLKQAADIADSMPLGSGALAGSAFPYRRDLVAKRLGFSRISQNSIDATSHRDFALGFLHALGQIGVLLSGYAEDFVMWSSLEFGFIRLGEAFTTGSSMMPQKKNPDSMELIRGKAGRLLGNYTRLFTTLKGLPHAYDRDLQEDKEPVFDSVDTVALCLDVMTEAMGTLEFKKEGIAARMHPGLLATDLADLLVDGGMPFREAHHVVGRLVAKADAAGVSFLDLPIAAWNDVPHSEKLRGKLTFAFSVSRRDIAGGTGPRSVKAQFKEGERLLAEAKKASKKRIS